MTILQAVILGLIQSITEFLPISSSAHLILFPWVLKFDTPGRAFDIALHLGTALAILLYFKKDFIKIIKEKNKKIICALITATLPAVGMGFYLAKLDLRNPLFIAICLAIFGILLHFTDKRLPKTLEIKDISLKYTLLIGCAQVLAMFPGVSRSGVTITAARLFKIKREAAAKFSFFMAIPVIFGAAILDFKKINNIINIEFFIGFIVSFFTGILVIKFFMKFINNHNFKVFMIYRIVIAVLIIIMSFTR
ncbi:MAG: undecaprenyl-diphosphate phosphatase [bacterium]|nr:undecaprenyl-diphosphate phosphatase [bacterium]